MISYYDIHHPRYTAATELVKSGVGVGTVRRLLGHRNLQTTQRYAELSGRAGYNYASSSTVRHGLDAFARSKNAGTVRVNELENPEYYGFG